MLRRIVFSVLGLLFAGLLAAGWYAYNKGFTHKWRAFVVTEFRKRGVELSLRRLTLEPFRGIVAKDVRIYENRERKRTLAVVDEVRLVINYAGLVQGKTFIEALDLHDANLDLPLDPRKPNGTKLAINHLSGLLFLPPQQAYLSRLEAEFYGLRLTASGRLINPQAFGKGSSDKSRLTAQILDRVIVELKALTFEGPPPQVDVRFSGDLGEPDRLFVEATLWAEKVRRQNYLCESLYIRAGFRDGTMSLKQLAAVDSKGSLRASGSYDVATREGTLQLHSDLDAQGLASAVAKIPELNEAVFYAPPEIEFTTRVIFKEAPSFHLLGRINQKKFAYKSVIFEGVAADFSWDARRWSARDVRIAHRSGEITGDVMQLPNELRTRLKSTIDRKVFAPLRTGRGAEWFRQFDFMNPA